MERFILIMFVLIANIAFWWEYTTSFNKTSDDGVVGKAFIGIAIMFASGLLLFNLDKIL